MKNQSNDPSLSAFAKSAASDENDAASNAADEVFAQAAANRRERLAQAATASTNSIEARRTELRDKRRKRVSLNGQQTKLDMKFTFGNEFYVYIFKDEGGRIQGALNAGYEFITPDEVASIHSDVAGGIADGDRVRVVLGSRDSGEPLYGYPMKQPWEFRQDDLEERELKNLEVDQLIRNGRLGMTQDEQRYIPRDTPIKYEPGSSSGRTPR